MDSHGVCQCLLLFITSLLYNVSSCKITVISHPNNIYQQYIENLRYEMNCVFQSTCRPNFSFEFNRLVNDNQYRPLWDYQNPPFRFSFQTFARVTGKNEYTSTLVVDPFKPHFAGAYKCIAQDSKNPQNKANAEFRMYPIELSSFSLYAQCFFPLVKSIRATPLLTNGVSLNIFLEWDLTEKEDPEIQYCIGSRMWRVRTLKYFNVDAAPLDYEVKTSSVNWINVTNENTNYTFAESLSTNVYYSFQVVHRGEFGYSERMEYDLKPIMFASQVYYYGEQTQASIQIPTDSTFKLPLGFSRSIHCDVGGIPIPSVKWIRESGTPPVVRLNDSAVLELKHVTQADAGVYYCIAFNILVNPPNGRRDEVDTWKITVIVEDEIPSTGVSCRILPLDSSVCKSYVYTGLKIYTNHTMTESSIDREDRAIDLTSVINYDIALGVCRDLAYSMMCHNVYPYCDVVTEIPTPRKLCNNVCQEFKTGKCKGYPLRESSLYEMLVNGCDDHEFTGGQSPECIPLSYQTYRTDQIESIEDTGNCIRDDGRGYSGNEYRTESGYLCQSWTKQTPHRHPMLPELYRTDLDQAHFSCRNPGGIGNRPWCYTNNPLVRWEYCSISKCDSCERYTGTMCNVLDGYATMNVSITKDLIVQSQQSIEESIRSFSKSVLIVQPTEGCKNILRVLLCHGAFPQCTASSNKQLCSIYCQFNQALENLCPNVYIHLSTFKKNSQYFMSTANCSSNNVEQCMMVQQLGSLLNSTESVTNNCYEGNGISYNGTISQTRDGIPCQAWDAQTPHSQPITSAQYPELINSNNYCRNPGNLKERPWCYTTHNDIVWDYCEIKHCSSLLLLENITAVIVSSSSPSSLPSSTKSDLKTVVISTASASAVLLVSTLICFIVVCYCFQKQKKFHSKTQSHLLRLNQTMVKNKDYDIHTGKKETIIGIHTCEKETTISIPDNFELLDSKNIKYVSQLGQGNFGIVFKGIAFGIKVDDGEGIDVAVKTLKESATSEVKQDFIDEAKLMFTFDHPNILKIHGVCMSEMPYQLVFEYMDEGDLTKFLRSRASSHQRRLVNPFSYRSRTESSFSYDPPSLNKTQLLYMCKQIADGMKYLADLNHVHRDLACRNCLIKSDLVVKIGDFGMSRNLYSKDYYRIKGRAVLPVRWMSPESLIYGKFSVEGDVWSFGIVMWEVFSFALQPYYGKSNEDVTEAIRRGMTLNRPDDCPIEIYRLMKECWTLDPAERISFPEIYNSLCKMHHTFSMSGSPDNKAGSDSLSLSDDGSDTTVFVDDNN